MDAAEEESQHDTVSAHGRLLKKQQCLGKLDAKLNQQTNVVCQSFLACTAIPTSILIPCPDKFSGDTSQCKGFLFQCSQYFARQAGLTDQQNIGQFLNLLTDKVLKLAMVVWEKVRGRNNACGWLHPGISHSYHWERVEWAGAESPFSLWSEQWNTHWTGMPQWPDFPRSVTLPSTYVISFINTRPIKQQLLHCVPPSSQSPWKLPMPSWVPQNKRKGKRSGCVSTLGVAVTWYPSVWLSKRVPP